MALKKEGYEEAAAFLESLPAFTKKNTLANTRAFFDLVMPHERETSFFHIAGTNGKGSCALYLESILSAAGEKTGAFLSPHVESPRERIRLSGTPVSEELFAFAVHEIRTRVEKNKERLCHPSYFEFLFLMAAWIFEREGVRTVILEAGLGGEKDATNIIRRPKAAVITAIGLDHCRYLGGTPEEIAKEKAGIMKRGCPLVFAADNPAVTDIITARAKKIHVPLFPVTQKTGLPLSQTKEEITFSAGLLSGEKAAFTLRARSPHQVQNAMEAVRAAEIFGITGAEVLAAGLYQAKLPFRMQEIRPGVYFDGAHNTAAIKAFLQTLAGMEERQANVQNRSLLFAVSEDKTYGEMAKLLAKEGGFQRIVLTGYPTERSADPAVLSGCMRPFTEVPLEVHPDPKEAYAYLRHICGEDETIFVTGSYYLLGALWKGEENNAEL